MKKEGLIIKTCVKWVQCMQCEQCVQCMQCVQCVQCIQGVQGVQGVQCNSTTAQLNKLNTLILKSYRVIIGSPCLKWNSNRLLNKCKLQTIWHMMTEQGLVYIHKIQTTKTPLAIYEMYKIPNRPKRTNIHLYPNYTTKTKILKTQYSINSLKYMQTYPIP